MPANCRAFRAENQESREPGASTRRLMTRTFVLEPGCRRPGPQGCHLLAEGAFETPKCRIGGARYAGDRPSGIDGC